MNANFHDFNLTNEQREFISTFKELCGLTESYLILIKNTNRGKAQLRNEYYNNIKDIAFDLFGRFSTLETLNHLRYNNEFHEMFIGYKMYFLDLNEKLWKKDTKPSYWLGFYARMGKNYACSILENELKYNLANYTAENFYTNKKS